jgi:hypothetical protein
VQATTKHGLQQPDPNVVCAKPTKSENIPPPDFQESIRICGAPSPASGCEDGQMCVPQPASPAAGPCIFKDGDEACPAEFPNKSLYHSSYSDTRACSACSCTATAGGCASIVTAFQAGQCDGTSIDQGISSASNLFCIPSNWTGLKLKSTTFYPGTCEKTGGQLTGTVVPTDPVTVCCL